MEAKKKVDIVRVHFFSWKGKDKKGRAVKGEMVGATENVVSSALRKEGITEITVKKAKSGGKKITEKDIALFTRQMATMMRAGVPLLQSFEIVGRGHANPAVGRLLLEIKAEIETGSSLSASFKKHPKYFDELYCNLVEAGEQAGILETILDRLATYKEKMLQIRSKIKGALTYPIAVIVVAFIVTSIIMIKVVPAFKEVFASFGSELPMPTQVVINISNFFVANWYFIFGGIGGAFYAFMTAWKKSVPMQQVMDRLFLKLPVFGQLIEKSAIARWTRTLSTMFAAGVPLVEALDSVGGAAGNYVYKKATLEIQREVSQGTSLTMSMHNSNIFPNMVEQMVSIGEESGALDQMLGKVADFYEEEIDELVKALSSLMEPIIMAFLGVVIGGLVVAMYMPIFKMGEAVH